MESASQDPPPEVMPLLGKRQHIQQVVTLFSKGQGYYTLKVYNSIQLSIDTERMKNIRTLEKPKEKQIEVKAVLWGDG